MLRFFTAGESHGPCLTAIVEGFPAGFPIDITQINHDLSRRQQGYGRGGRMKIEKDEALIHSGVRWGESLGSPITLVVQNRDWRNWEKRMSPFAEDKDGSIAVTRPGYADLTCEKTEVYPVRLTDGEAEKKIIALIDQCKKQGDTLGGVVEVAATGLPPGLGSFVQWDRKLDGRLGSALLSLQSAKEVEVGLRSATAKLSGSQVHDEIAFNHNTGFIPQSNNSGGTEGGMSAGEPLRGLEQVRQFSWPPI